MVNRVEQRCTPAGLPLYRRQIPGLQDLCILFIRVLGWILCFTLLVGVIAAILASYVILPPENAQMAAGSIIHVSPGSTSEDIGRLLQQAGVVRSQLAFTWMSRLLGLDERLQAGDYRLSPGMNLLEIIERLEAGRVIVVRVTIPEGLTAREIAARLAQKRLVDEQRFLTLVRDERLVYGENAPIDKPTVNLEGYLFPDTYRFTRDQSEEEIIKTMVRRFQEVALPVIQDLAGEQGATVHEIVTLASMIEKEVMVDRERPLVSAVFWNRLKIGMPLQSDPTVQFVMEQPRRKLYYADLAIDSPYNTYKYRGLPPGPIASPGLASIKAALQPAQVDYLYFVAKGDGTHAFSRTYREHKAARRRYGM